MISEVQDNIENCISNKHFHAVPCSRHPQPSEVLLSSAKVNSGPITFTKEAPPFVQTFNQPLTSITLNAGCFSRAKVLIRFVGSLTETPNYFLTLTVPTGILIFTLYKICEKSSIRQVAATYTINYTDISGYSGSRALDFEYFTCDEQWGECYTYTLELTSISDSGRIDSNYFFTGVFSALAVGTRC
ncbi:DUF4489 domain-containing protein [Clostridium oryzae]|uniref:DUF4489 domain-containing protein n=1 Tax=Clostridium oryzae TaxID=1450648 RepID=UPI0014743660|nr:DUF4489 domain-containing protein [Clostridium oryzae]